MCIKRSPKKQQSATAFFHGTGLKQATLYIAEVGPGQRANSEEGRVRRLVKCSGVVDASVLKGTSEHYSPVLWCRCTVFS